MELQNFRFSNKNGGYLASVRILYEPYHLYIFPNDNRRYGTITTVDSYFIRVSIPV